MGILTFRIKMIIARSGVSPSKKQVIVHVFSLNENKVSIITVVIDSFHALSDESV